MKTFINSEMYLENKFINSFSPTKATEYCLLLGIFLKDLEVTGNPLLDESIAKWNALYFFCFI